jgi:cob(I)alamin adenosyltransferase
MEIRQCGHGFTQQPGEDQAEHRQAAAAALQEAKRAAASGKWDMIILDELNYAVKFGLVSLEEVLDLLQSKPPMLHLVLTGRDARQELIDAADLVTEMKLIKHPFQNGIKAQKGVEF